MRKLVTISVPEELYPLLRQEAKKAQRSISSYVCYLLQQRFIEDGVLERKVKKTDKYIFRTGGF